VSASAAAELWFRIGWCIDRTIASRSMIFATRGRYSPTVIPGTAVGIVAYSPRTPAGAFGLGSYVSNWLGPP